MKIRAVTENDNPAFAPAAIEKVVEKIKSEKPAVVFAPHVETSSGIILPDDYIEVIFVEDIVEETALNKKVTNPFTFSPAISGEAMWTSRDVLTFVPDKPLSSRTNYTGELELKNRI